MSIGTLGAAIASRTSFNWPVLAICSAASFVEGYDAQVIGYAAPAISHDWELGRGALGAAFSAGNFGLLLGAALLAPLSDRFGRKRIVIVSVLLFAILTALTALATDLTEMIWFRLVTCIAVGAALPNVIALNADMNPQDKRAAAVAIGMCGFAIGSAASGLAIAWLTPAHGWQGSFIAGGVLAFLLLPALMRWLPESVRATDAKPTSGANPVADLFREGRARVTITLWFIFFMSLTCLYLMVAWLPSILREQGLSESTAVLAASLMQLGGIAGSLLLGPLVDRRGIKNVAPYSYCAAALFVVGLAIAGSNVMLVFLLAFATGAAVVGSQNCINGATTKFYPKRMRATGIGWALGIGRIGSIAGPGLAGILLSFGWGVFAVFLFTAVPALLASVAFLALRGSQEFIAGED